MDGTCVSPLVWRQFKEIVISVFRWTSSDLMAINQSGPTPLAAPSRTWVCDRTLARIADSNPAGGMDVSLVSRVVRQTSVRRACHSSRWVLPSECGGSECDREASIMRSPWPTRGRCITEDKNQEWRRKVKAKTRMAGKKQRTICHCLHRNGGKTKINIKMRHVL